MSLQTEAKMKTVEEIAKLLDEKEAPPMAALAMNMQTIMVIDMYDTNLAELSGDTKKLIEALAVGGFTDENGTSLTDTITFKKLKDSLGE